MPRKPKSLQAQQTALRKRGRSALTEGQANILLAQIIDLLADGKTNKDCFALIKEFYHTTLNQDLAPSSYYEILSRAKSLWLTNVTLPSLENYRKEKLIKSEELEEQIKLKSKQDIVNQAKTTIDIWKYQDNIMGLDKDNNNDINIVIGLDMNKTQQALELVDLEEEEENGG